VVKLLKPSAKSNRSLILNSPEAKKEFYNPVVLTNSAR